MMYVTYELLIKCNITAINTQRDVTLSYYSDIGLFYNHSNAVLLCCSIINLTSVSILKVTDCA